MRRVLGLVVLLAAMLPAAGDAQEGIRYSAPNSGINPRLTPVFWDDFSSGNSSGSAAGDLRWNFIAGTWAGLPGEADHPGLLRNTTSAVGGTVTTAYLSQQFFTTLGDITNMEAQIRWADAASPPKRRFGVSTVVNTDMPTAQSGIYFEHIGGTDTNWFAVTNTAATATRVDTGVAFAADTWITFRIAPSGSNWLFYINDVLVATGTANVPAASTAVDPVWQMVSGGAAIAATIDWFRLDISVTR